MAFSGKKRSNLRTSKDKAPSGMISSTARMQYSILRKMVKMIHLVQSFQSFLWLDLLESSQKMILYTRTRYPMMDRAVEVKSQKDIKVRYVLVNVNNIKDEIVNNIKDEYGYDYRGIFECYCIDQKSIMMRNQSFEQERKSMAKRVSEQHYDAKREVLIEQILSYRRRVQQYQALSREVKTISSTIHNSQSLQSQNQNLKLTQNSLTLNKFYQANPLTFKQKLQRRTSSSKKIKIYELQKKLFRLTKEYNQHFTDFMSHKRQLQITQQTITQLNSLINQQQVHKSNLHHQKLSILNQLQQAISQSQAKEKQLQSTEARKCMYKHEKESFLTHIESLTSKFQELVQERENQKNGRISKKFLQYQLKYQLHPLQQKQQKDRQQSLKHIQINGAKYELVQSDCSLNLFLVNQETKSSDTENGKVRGKNIEEQNKTIANHCNSTQPTQALQYQTNSIQQNPSKKQKTLDEPIHINELENKLQILQSTNCQLNNELYLLDQEMVSIQTQIKHHQTTLHLLHNKLKSYDLFIQKQKKKQIQNISTVDQLYNQLSQKQGYRGEIRGRIGTKVQQQSLIKMLNLALQKDLSNLTSKTTSLIAFKNILSHNIIKNQPFSS